VLKHKGGPPPVIISGLNLFCSGTHCNGLAQRVLRCVVFSFLISPSLSFGKSMSPISLIISGRGQHEYNDRKTDQSKTFASVCPTLAAAFYDGEPPFGFGPFASVRCVDVRPATAYVGLWNLNVVTNLLGTRFELYDLKKKEPVLLFSYYLPLTSKVLDALGNRAAAQAIAWRIVREMPFLGTLSPEAIESGKSMFAHIGSLPKAAYAIPLVIYERVPSVTPNISRVKVVGQATFVKVVNSRAEWSLVFVKGFVPKPGGGYFLHNGNYDKNELEALSDVVHPLTKPYEQAFYNVAASGYIGIRYGRSLSKGEPLLTSDLLGLFFESRGGLISGFRFNHDRAPSKSVVTSSVKSSFGWSRTQVGLGFGRNIDVPVISWIDVMPRLGVTNLSLKNTNLTVADLSYEMIVKNALCTGVEVGVENRATKFLIRGWGLVNYALGTQLAKTTSVFQYRTGLDVFKDAGNISKYVKFKGLGFVTFESTTLKNTSKQKTEASVNELNFTNMYVGLGAVLAW
jgi:hypothetical protein